MRMKFCVACFSDKNLHHHHLIAKSLGGSDAQENLITLCGSCHGKIHNVTGDFINAPKRNIGLGVDLYELQQIGIKKALTRGVIFGAKPKLSDTQIHNMYLDWLSNTPIKQLIIKYGISKASVYRLLTKHRTAA